MATEITDTYYGRQLGDVVLDTMDRTWVIAYTVQSDGTRAGTSYMAHRYFDSTDSLSKEATALPADSLWNN